MLGLVAVKDGVCGAVTRRQLGVDLGTGAHGGRRSSSARRGRRGPRPSVGLTPRAKRVIELAIDEARRLEAPTTSARSTCCWASSREGEGIEAGVLECDGREPRQGAARRSSRSSRRRTASRSVRRRRAAGRTGDAVVGTGPPLRPVRRLDGRPPRGAHRRRRRSAASEGAPEIGTDDLLLGLVAAPAGAATALLAILGVERSTLQGSVAGARDAGTDAWSHGMRRGAATRSPAGRDARTDLSPQARMALDDGRGRGAPARAERRSRAGHLLIGARPAAHHDRRAGARHSSTWTCRASAARWPRPRRCRSTCRRRPLAAGSELGPGGLHQRRVGQEVHRGLGDERRREQHRSRRPRGDAAASRNAIEWPGGGPRR